MVVIIGARVGEEKKLVCLGLFAVGLVVPVGRVGKHHVVLGWVVRRL